ncbi:MAG: hypothetical protein J6K84_00520 [Oscillospiraceae bacterium]|nr:hypothetical protein [Oscillospiraceae bacterium]
MTAYLYTVGKGLWKLNSVLSYRFSRTDGEECEEATITIPYDPQQKEVLEHGYRLVLIEGNKAVYVGILDGFSAVIGSEGRTVSIQSRGMQAFLMDNEMRAKLYPVLDLQTAVYDFCYNNNAEMVEWAQDMPPVENFYIESGQTAWEALRGFCRQSMNARPRCSANGTVYLVPPAPNFRSITEGNAILRAEYRYNRKGAITRQTIVAHNGDGTQSDVETATHDELIALAVRSERITLHQGKNLKASWRTASQRVDDSVRRGREISLLLGEAYWAEPGDFVYVNLPQLGIMGQYTLQKIIHSMDDSLGRRTELVLEAPL